MSRFLPQTMFGQTLVALMIGIGLSLSAGAWIYGGAGQEAVRAVGALGAAERIINLVKLVDDMPPEFRERLVRGSSEASFKVSIEQQQPVQIAHEGETFQAPLIADFIKTALSGREVLVAVTGSNVPHLAPPFMQGMRPGFGHGAHGSMMSRLSMQDVMMPGALMRAGMSWRGLEAAIMLADGRWLTISTTLPDTGPALSLQAIVALAVAAGLIALLVGWTVRRMTRPLAILATAANELGRNMDAPPLVASGTIEVRRASDAFNNMQARLKRLIENRTLMLAALSHDVRTQLTLLRLRAETVEEPDNREKMLATISDMESMLTATLTFARDEAASEGRKRVDVSALVSSIADDMADAGLPVAVGSITDGIDLDCKPVALRRAVTNLIDNAVKYGLRARVSMYRAEGRVAIAIDDDGPGIPEGFLARVLQPFYRVEDSRSRDTGGMGLGLAISATIAEAHGGSLILANRPEGGLRATFTLPQSEAFANKR